MSKNSVLLKDVEAGDIFRFGEMTFVATEAYDDAVLAVCTRIVGRYPFETVRADEQNNFCGSTLSRNLEKRFKDSCPAVWDAAIPQEIDLTALNGDTQYDRATVKIGIPTLDHYRAWKDLYPNTILDGFWLATPSFCGRWASTGEYTALVVTKSRKISPVASQNMSGAVPTVLLPNNLTVDLLDNATPTTTTTAPPTAVTMLNNLSSDELMEELQRRMKAGV